MVNNLDLSATLKLIDDISAPLRGIIDKSDKLSRSFERATRTVDAFNSSLAQVNNSGLSRVNQPLGRTNSLLSTARQHAKGLATDFALVFKSVVAVQRKADGLAKSFAATRKQMRQEVLNSAVALGGAALVGYQVLKPSIEFDKQMSANQAVLELEKTSAEMTKLRSQAISEGARSAFSASQAAQAQFELAAGGFSAKQVMDSLAGSLDLAAAGQVDLALAAQIAVGTLNGFGMEAKEIGRMNDVLVATANKSAVGIEDLGEAMKYAAPIARLYGTSIEKTSAMMGILGDNNIKGSEAGTGIRTILTRLASTPKPVREALGGLKIETVNKDGTMRQIDEVLAEINQKTKNLNDDVKFDIFKSLAGEEHLSKFAVLVANSQVLDKNTGKVVNNITEFTKELENAKDLAGKVAATRMDNLAGDIDQMKGAWESMSITLGGEGGALNSALRAVVTNVTEIINKITAWAQANPELVKTIGALALKFIKINAAIWAVKYGAALMFGTFFSMAASFIKFGASIMIFNAILAKLGISFWGKFKLMGQALLWFSKLFGRTFWFLARNAVPFLITALGQLSVALVTTPIGWAIMAIAVAGLLLIKYWQPVKAFFAGMWTGFMQGIAPLQATLGNLGSMLSTTFAPLRPVLDLIIAGITWLGSALMSLIAPFQATDSQLATATSYGSQFGFVLGTIVSLIGQVVAGLVGALALGLQTIGTAIGTFAAMIVVHGGAAINYVAGIPSRMMAFLAGLPAQMSAMGGQIMDGLKNGIVGKATAVVDSILSVANRIKSAFTGTKGMVIKSPSRVFRGYGGYMMQGLNQGILSNDSPVASMLTTSNNLRDAMDTSEIRFDNRKPISASAMMGGANGSQNQAPIINTFNIYAQPGQSEQQIADLVATTLAKQQRSQSTNNTALYDLAEQW
ncbi:hypothetical protein PSYCG_09920 [Psychrobacter sp. G]|uniref:phage tail tape measure protein n=1 Tax=Psychrobacter sp. G TaxID=571800 RepID=UPI000354DEB0|nr:phage tail tape measure protein [Psychrobacter sp. G]AGP49472.1 hypothetical protein PSYCG_09920 [Psychrobacter sp. G]